MKFSRIIILSIAALFLLVGSAVATTVYNITYDNTGCWSVNWTSSDSEYFFGSIVVGGITVKWDDDNVTVYDSPTLNFFNYSSGSGFGFTTSEEDSILFKLGSSESFDIYFDLGEGKDDPTIETNYSFSGTINDNQVTGVMKSFKIPSAPVPEPATMFLLGSGLVGLAGFGRKRITKKG